MNLEFESLLIAFIFLVPGFIANIFARAADRRRTQLEELLAFLSYGLLVFGALFVPFILFSSGGAQIAKLETLGIARYVQDEPATATFIVIYWLGGSILLAAVVGYFDPLETVAKYLQLQKGFTPADIWYRTLEGRGDSAEQHAWAIVRMKNNDYYEGELQHYNIATAAEDRDFTLQQASYVPKGMEKQSEEIQIIPLRGVLLNTSQVTGVELLLMNDEEFEEFIESIAGTTYTEYVRSRSKRSILIS